MTTMSVRTVLATLALALAAPVQAGFKEGALAYSHGDYATALKELEPLAAQGDASAQYLVGAARSNAKPPLQDIAQAEKWLRSAAAQGHLKAMVSLGNLFAFYTQPPDYKQALDWFKKAAERCHLIAAVTQHAIRDKFSAADIAAGNERARRWHCQP
jgi:TPR repeat protein